MGRVKLEIKKIENTTNRQVTFSKRRNGLIKKAYELSVLCDVDVALIMFSPSGRLSIFSGNRSIEEIMARYVNLPDHERGRLHNQEHLQRALGKLKSETDPTFQAASSSPASDNDSQVEEIQQEIMKCRCQLEEMEKRLRIYEGDSSEIATLCEAEYREQILEDNLKLVRARKQTLQNHYMNLSPTAQTTSDQMNFPSEMVNITSFGTRNPNDVNLDRWFPQRDPQAQILNFLDSNGLLPLSHHHQTQHMDGMMPSTMPMVHSPAMQASQSHLNPSRPIAEEHHDGTQQPEFNDDQVNDHVNLSAWTELYQTGNNPFPTTQPRERALLELFLSQLTPVNQHHI